jgi:hypothetical protein
MFERDEIVVWAGRRWVVCELSPGSGPERIALLQDMETHERASVPLGEIETEFVARVRAHTGVKAFPEPVGESR